MVQYDLTNIFQSFLDIQRVKENEAPFIKKMTKEGTTRCRINPNKAGLFEGRFFW